MVEPRGTGMALFTLRAADEVRAAQFPSAEDELDPEMVAIATGDLRPAHRKIRSEHVSRPLQEALRDLIEAKMKGLPIKPRAVTEPPPVIDVTAALKRSLAQEAPAKSDRRKTEKACQGGC